MLTTVTNTPRDYDWGSTVLLADLEGRPATGAHEAEIWFGDHPGSPSVVPGGRPLGDWLAQEGAQAGAPARLPFLLKLLAAASSLSIQAHPSRAQAVEAFAREEAAGIPRDAPERTFRDENHKPELIVAVSETFTALAGIRELDATRRLLAVLGSGGAALAERLSGLDADTRVRDAIAWLLSGEASDDIASIAAAAGAAASEEFEAEFALLRRLAADFPGDPGLGVALLMNLVVLRRGEGLFVPAGVLHAYQEGLGVEIMAASDNVLRGGLTSKHVDVPELLRVLDPTPGPVGVLRPEVEGGTARFAPDVPDFALTRVTVSGGDVVLPIGAVAIALGTTGSVSVRGGRSGEDAVLRPGRAVLITPDESRLVLAGDGEVFVAEPGTAWGSASAS